MFVALLALCSAQYGPDPPGLPDDVKCGWRQLAYEYGTKLRPDAAHELSAALDLKSFCPGTVRPNAVTAFATAAVSATAIASSTLATAVATSLAATAVAASFTAPLPALAARLPGRGVQDGHRHLEHAQRHHREL